MTKISKNLNLSSVVGSEFFGGLTMRFKFLVYIFAMLLGSNTFAAEDIFEPTTENLVQAIMVNDVPRLQNLIRQGVDVNAKYRDRYPIHFAAEYAKSSTLQLLIADKINLDSQVDGTGETALHLTVGSSNVILTQLLIDAGENPNFVDAFGNSPLHLATENLDLVRAILSSKQVDLNIRDQEGKTCLMRASGNGNPNSQVVLYLLKSGSDFSAVDAKGMSALDHAEWWLNYFQNKPVLYAKQIQEEHLIIQALTGHFLPTELLLKLR